MSYLELMYFRTVAFKQSPMRRTALVVCLLSIAELALGQCQEDPSALKYKGLGAAGKPNAQSCNMCGVLAIYMCTATSTKYCQDQKMKVALTNQIEATRNSIRALHHSAGGSPCCPELLTSTISWCTREDGPGPTAGSDNPAQQSTAEGGTAASLDEVLGALSGRFATSAALLENKDLQGALNNAMASAGSLNSAPNLENLTVASMDIAVAMVLNRQLAKERFEALSDTFNVMDRSISEKLARYVTGSLYMPNTSYKYLELCTPAFEMREPIVRLLYALDGNRKISIGTQGIEELVGANFIGDDLGKESGVNRYNRCRHFVLNSRGKGCAAIDSEGAIMPLEGVAPDAWSGLSQLLLAHGIKRSVIIADENYAICFDGGHKYKLPQMDKDVLVFDLRTGRALQTVPSGERVFLPCDVEWPLLYHRPSKSTLQNYVIFNGDDLKVLGVDDHGNLGVYCAQLSGGGGNKVIRLTAGHIPGYYAISRNARKGNTNIRLHISGGMVQKNNLLYVTVNGGSLNKADDDVPGDVDDVIHHLDGKWTLPTFDGISSRDLLNNSYIHNSAVLEVDLTKNSVRRTSEPGYPEIMSMALLPSSDILLLLLATPERRLELRHTNGTLIGSIPTTSPAFTKMVGSLLVNEIDVGFSARMFLNAKSGKLYVIFSPPQHTKMLGAGKEDNRRDCKVVEIDLRRALSDWSMSGPTVLSTGSCNGLGDGLASIQYVALEETRSWICGSLPAAYISDFAKGLQKDDFENTASYHTRRERLVSAMVDSLTLAFKDAHGVGRTGLIDVQSCRYVSYNADKELMTVLVNDILPVKIHLEPGKAKRLASDMSALSTLIEIDPAGNGNQCYMRWENELLRTSFYERLFFEKEPG